MQTTKITIIKKDVKNITLKVKPTCEVELVVPKRLDQEYIELFLEKKRLWIEKKLAFFRSKLTPPKEYVNGENFEYLGKNYRLKVIEDHNEQVVLDRNVCYLFVKDKSDFQRKEKIIQKWYRTRAYELFWELIRQYQPIVKREVKSLRVKKMKTRWGSCNYHKAYINLNLELIKKPKESIEYVVFHELAHLIHPNHSKAFYNFLTTYMPDWKKRREKL